MDKIIGDIFEKYQVRKSKKQKTEFINYVSEKAAEEGFSVNVEKGMFGVRNIVVGNPDTAKVIYTAHYDTCARLPFPNFLTPKNIGLYLLYNLVIIIGFLLIAFVFGVIIGTIGGLLSIDKETIRTVGLLVYWAFFFLILCGPANKHTANDNTSGVTVLFGIMKSLPKENRDKVALVFFDQEELGLFGSSAFAKKHKSIKQKTLLLNFDCVSDGQDIIILVNKAAADYRDIIADSFKDNGDIKVDVTDKAFYPSDQVNFKKGVGIAAFKKTKGGTLYINKIHTSRDVVFQRENIDYLVEGSVKLAEKL